MFVAMHVIKIITLCSIQVEIVKKLIRITTTTTIEKNHNHRGKHKQT